VAPALHSLTIGDRYDAEVIPELLLNIRGLRKLILQECCLGDDSSGLLPNIVDFYPDLEGLSLEGCFSLTSDVYCLLSCLKKLSKLKLSFCEVQYMCVLSC
jgi:hypothetical protein